MRLIIGLLKTSELGFTEHEYCLAALLLPTQDRMVIIMLTIQIYVRQLQNLTILFSVSIIIFSCEISASSLCNLAHANDYFKNIKCF